jgi:hypothetical protein
MSYNLQRSTHFDSSESNAIQRDMALGRYKGFRNTFDEWETRKARAEDAPQQTLEEDDHGGEDDLERARRSR